MKKKSLALLIVGMMTATGALTPISAMAETADKKIEQQDKEIATLKEKQKSVTTQITSLEEEISSIYDRGIELNQQKTSLIEKSEQLKKDIAALDVRINKRTEAIQNQGRNVQVNGQGAQILDMILNAESISDAVGRVQAISSILTANNNLVKQQKEDKKLVETKKVDIQTNLAAVEDATKQLEKERESLVSKQADLNVLKAEVDSEAASAQDSKNELVKKQQEALKAQLIAEAKQAENKKAATAKENKTTQTTASEISTEPSTSEEVPGSNSSEQNNTTPSESNSTGQGNTTPSEEPKDPTPTPPATSADATFQALNALRTANGLNPVSWDAGLAASAGARASMMQDYQIPSDHWNRGDEVIAFMFAPGNSVIMAWYNETNMSSPSGTGHRDWEMNPSMTRVGFGYAGDVIVGHSA